MENTIYNYPLFSLSSPFTYQLLKQYQNGCDEEGEELCLSADSYIKNYYINNSSKIVILSSYTCEVLCEFSLTPENLQKTIFEIYPDYSTKNTYLVF